MKRIGFPMKLFKLNKNTWKHAHWWEKQKRDWAIEDKDGVWWIVPGSEMAEKKLKQKVSHKNIKKSSIPATIDRMLLIVLACAFGVSLAINVIFIILAADWNW